MYQYQYVLGYQSKFPDDKLTFGTQFHNKGLEPFWLGNEAKDVDYDAFEDTDQAIICEALIESYYNKYDCDGVNALEVEKKYEIHTADTTGYTYGVGTGTTRVAVFDAIIEYSGRTLLVESKTTRQYLTGEWYWDKLDLDLQTGYYVWFAKQVGYDIDGVLYDVSRVPKMAMGKDGRRSFKETEDQFYNRVLDKLSQDSDAFHQRRLIQPNVDDIMKQVDMWEEAMVNAAKYDRYPRNHTSCFMYGRKCEFKPVCAGNSSLDNERLYQLRKKEK